MIDETLTLTAIKELLGDDNFCFYVPSYQRGYRWDNRQVEDFLDDILVFHDRINGKGNENSNEFYCIQPLVVSRHDNKYYVVDGQQRLTTIYLVLKFLAVHGLYHLEYETRKDSKEFLVNVENKTKEDAAANVDFYYFFEVFETIKSWFYKKAEEDKNIRTIIESTLLENVKFIWYEIDQKDEIATFTRLNIGKIPLADSELVKALFLRRDERGDSRIETLCDEIAIEWDNIERTLQNDEFWAFIYGSDYKKPTRIDFVLDIARKCKGGYVADERDKDHPTFRYYLEVFNRNKNEQRDEFLREQWLNIKEVSLILEEWYHDYKLFHYIGFLTCTRDRRTKQTDRMVEYVNFWTSSKTRDEFFQKMKKQIKKKLVKNKKNYVLTVESLRDYEFDSGENCSDVVWKCRNLLLLHNVETIVQQNDKLVADSKFALPNFSKFPFHLYLSEKWDIEHIRPYSGDDLESESKQNEYLEMVKPYASKELQKEICDYLDDASESKNFESIHAKVDEEMPPLNDVNKNQLWNFV